jgi:hypothetical protein
LFSATSTDSSIGPYAFCCTIHTKCWESSNFNNEQQCYILLSVMSQLSKV